MGNFRENVKTYLEKTDNWLWVFTGIATIYSLLLISDMQRAGDYNYLFTQIIAILIGIALAVLISLVNYKYLIKYWWIFALTGIGLAASVFVFGVTVNGTDDTAWIQLPGGFTIQPSEFMKLCFIITFSKHLSYLNDTEKLKTPFGVIGLAIHLGIPIILIHLQGDDGAVLIFIFIALAMMFLAGVQTKYFAILGGALAVGLPLLWSFVLNDEHRNRILALFDLDGNALTNYGWQQYQSKVSIASGQLAGEGLYNGNRVAFGIVPEQENDFIFTVAGEEFGFIGCIILLAILVVIISRLLIDAKSAYENKGSYICYGVFGLIASQTIINIGMVLGIVPVIGITLPFFSSGGSSVMSMMIAIGLVQSVLNNQEKDMDKAKIRIGSQSRAKV
ncbi:MAG: FtsW/RodA/SpoVE family cell cycle protein [Ruminococcus sp.]|nr:FtsW/RodA/SpoVE family cell cycle protein [Ruminococcus sp.]